MITNGHQHNWHAPGRTGLVNTQVPHYRTTTTTITLQNLYGYPNLPPITDDNDKGRMTTTIRDGWIGTLNRYAFYASFFSHLLLTNVPLISIFLIFQHLFRLHQFLSQRTSQLVSSGHASPVVRDTQVCFFP